MDPGFWFRRLLATEKIADAFKGVTLGGGRGLLSTQYCGPNGPQSAASEAAAEAAREHDLLYADDWTKFPMEFAIETLGPNGPNGPSFLDPEGFRYFLPAALTWMLMHGHGLAYDLIVYTTCPGTCWCRQRTFLFNTLMCMLVETTTVNEHLSLLTPEQRGAVKAAMDAMSDEDLDAAAAAAAAATAADEDVIGAGQDGPDGDGCSIC